MKERRQHLRVDIRTAAVCEIEGVGAFNASASDLSLGGARVDCDLVIDYGTEFTLVVDLPGAPQPSRIPATVRWTAPGAFGVQFGPMGAQDTNHIARLIERKTLDTVRMDVPIFYLDDSDLTAIDSPAS